MAGIIITGHGKFPEGVLSAIELVAGKPEHVTGVNFLGGQSSQELKEAMAEAVDRMEENDILILADLAGGTPFNTAALLKAERADKNIRLLAGTNLPAVVEAVFSRACVSFEELIPMVKAAAEDGVVNIDELGAGEEEPEFSDGL